MEDWNSHSQSHRTYSGVLISRVPLFLGVFFKKASTACGNWPRQTLIIINLIGQCKVSILLHSPPFNMALYISSFQHAISF